MQKSQMWSRAHTASGRLDRIVDEIADEWQVQNVDALLYHGNAARLHLRSAHQREGQRFEEWWLRRHVKAKTNSAHESLQLDKDRERYSKETLDSKIEDQLHVHISCLVGGPFPARCRMISERGFQVVVVTTLFVSRGL